MSIIDRIKGWLNRSETNQLGYDQRHQRYVDTHHPNPDAKPDMQDRIDPDE